MKPLCLLFLLAGSLLAAEKPNVIVIICDDLNGYVQGFGGHPQAHTPNMARLAASGVSFQSAHCTIPICAPSRSSFLTGLYPHTTRNYGFARWDHNEILKNSRTVMDHFRANGYHTLGTGKFMHTVVTSEWSEWGHKVDYGPFPFDGTDKIAHPDTPSPLRDDFGAVDGSFGPLVNLKGRTSPDGKPLTWRTGHWSKMRPMKVNSQSDRDPTTDEINGAWAVEKLKALAANPDGKPFFMGVGFIRPHTPLIVPQRFFDQFPLDAIKLPVIKPGDVDDTWLKTISGTSKDDRDRGAAIFSSLVASYGGDQDLALRKFIQAYLASVASVDELIGNILDTVESSALKDNTVIVLTSDHGWGMGEKDYLYKNSLWEESTRVPLIIRAPGVARPDSHSDHPVSLVDLFPTLIDLCGLKGETVKNKKGRPLDGHSLKPFLLDPEGGQWDGPDAALTAVYRWAQTYHPKEQSYALRSKDWRYISYKGGKEELYDHRTDPHEWSNLADDPKHAKTLASFRQQLADRIPDTPPPAKPEKRDAAHWKNLFFKKHPEADTDKDGKLSWPEFHAAKKKRDAEK